MNAQASNDHASAAPQEDLRALLRAELAPMFKEMRGFVDRRIAELSAEVAATSEMADMAEEKLSKKLGQVHEQIAQLVAIPAASTRNSGLELEAVVQATEAAANTIMEATEAIQAWISSGQKDQASIEALSARVNSIFEACSFQDVTGQRIRRAIQHLQQVETMLEQIVPGAISEMPIPQVRVATQMRTVTGPAQVTPDLSQSDIDALLNASPAPQTAELSQADIDALLNG